MNNKKIIYAAGVALLLAQAATPIINVTAISNDSQRTVIPTNFPKGNFQGDFTVDAQNTTVNAGQSANFNIYLKSTGAVTNLSNVDLKVQLPKQDYVEFSQSLDALKLNNVVPKYDKTSGLLTWHFDKLPTGQVNKTVLRLDTINGGFTNQTPIKISGTLTADSDKGAIKAQTGGQTVVNATKNLSLINKFQSIYNNDVSSETYHTNPVIGDEILWNVGIGAPKKVEGSIFLKPGSKLEVSYIIDDKLKYEGMANSSSPTPTVDGNALKWEITAPSIQEQMNNSSFLEKDLSLKLKVKDDKNNVFKDATNTLKITKATFNDGEDFLPNSIDGKITISQSDADKLPPQTGSYYNPEHFGPKDGEGNLAGVKEYVDPQVTDDATLAFGMRVSSMYTNSQEEDLKAYTVHYKVDPNLKIKKFYSGDFNMSTGKGGVVGKPLKNLSHYSFNVRYTDDSDDVPSKISGTEVVNPITGDPVIYQDAHKNNWHTLVADVPLGKWLTAKDLNIPENKTIKEIMLHFHPAKGTVRHDIFNKDKTYIATGDENGLPDYYEADPTGYYGQQGSDLSYLENWAPAGMYSNNVDFKMGIKKGYIGQVKNSMYINNYGTTAKGKGFWLGSEYEWNDKYSAMIAGAQAQTAEVVKAVTGINRVLKTSVAFDYLSELPDGQKVLSPGENSVTTSIDNTQTSKNSAPGPMISYVLLPKSVQYIGDIDGTNGKVSQLLSDNYQGSGQSLVKVNYSSDNIQPNKNISQQFKVNVTDGVSTDPEIKVYSFIGSDDFSVPDIKGTPVITDTKKDVDKDNLNGNGTDKPMFYSGRDYHFDKANALSVSETVEKQAETVKKVAGDKVNYQLQLTNTSEDDLNNMILMDTLPSVGDLSITTNEDRGSQFDMSLTGPINIPKSWEDKVNVEYTTSSNPKKSGILDKDTIYPSTAQKLEDAQGAEDATWVSAKDVTDWTKIKAFKIELKDKTTWVSGADMAINFGMKVPEDAEAKTTAYNSFAFASNASQVIEPYRLGVEIKDPVGPKQIPTLPVKPNQPGNKDNPGSNTEDNNNSKTDKGSNNGNRGTNVSNYNNLPRTGENIRNTSILTIVGLLLITVTEYFVIKNKKNRNI